MEPFVYKDVTYQVDDQGFLLDPLSWNENFAEGTAKGCGISELTSEHWDIIRYLRDSFEQNGECPTVYATSKASGLRPQELQRLFPTGYHRGVCRIAGIHYRSSRMPKRAHPSENVAGAWTLSSDKVYDVDVRGFLIDPESWDKNYATYRAMEMKIPEGRLNQDHWRVIECLRESYQQEKRVPTIYEICEKCDLELEAFEALFPTGYHRGAVKIAGLRFVK